MRRRWLVNRTNPEFVQYLSRAASVSPIIAQVLINRGMKTAAEVRDFLDPGISSLTDPYELPDMRPAVDRVVAALLRNERVLVHGDYDTDGVTATAIMVRALRTAGLDVRYFIPNRVLHGYGFKPHALAVAQEIGAGLIITVDCGITSFDAASLARQQGIDVIITDHHEPAMKPGGEGGFLLPEAVAVINPKIQPEKPQGQTLSGAGIALKFAHALALDDRLRLSEEECLALCDLASLGTVADVVPLVGENRAILREGLKMIKSDPRPGIHSLKTVCGLNTREIKAGLLSFTLVPRINAAGRIADANDVVRLLLSEKEEDASSLSRWLDGLNAERQKVEESVYQSALAKLQVSGVDPVIVLSGAGWHEGVLGIVASRIAEQYCRPTFVFSISDGVAKGSARSIPSFDICNALALSQEHLLSFGGHKQAAGVRLEVSRLEGFTRAMRNLLQESTGEEDLVPSLEIDANILLSDVSHSLMKELGKLEPFGYGNAEPVFGSKELDVINPRIVGNNHLKMRLRQKAQTHDAIGFDLGAMFEEMDSPVLVDAVFSASVNDWNGGRYLQLVLKALRPSA